MRDRLTKIEELDVQIALRKAPIGTDAMFRRIHREERAKVIAELKMLAIECELNIDSLLFQIANVEQTVAVKK